MRFEALRNHRAHDLMQGRWRGLSIGATMAWHCESLIDERGGLFLIINSGKILLFGGWDADIL